MIAAKAVLCGNHYCSKSSVMRQSLQYVVSREVIRSTRYHFCSVAICILAATSTSVGNVYCVGAPS